jgi:hypothetical protein
MRYSSRTSVSTGYLTHTYFNPVVVNVRTRFLQSAVPDCIQFAGFLQIRACYGTVFQFQDFLADMPSRLVILSTAWCGLWFLFTTKIFCTASRFRGRSTFICEAARTVTLISKSSFQRKYKVKEIFLCELFRDINIGSKVFKIRPKRV